MGILMTVFMALGLGLTPFKNHSLFKQVAINKKNVIFIGLFLSGCWNTCWYGSQNFEYFWGKAALISGIFMMVAALRGLEIKALGKTNTMLKAISPIIWLGLLISFMLYLITLVQLNLGLPILK